MCYSQIWQNFGGDEYLRKLGKEYVNALLCKFVVYSLQYSETFDVSHVFLLLTITELSMLKQVRFFLAHPVYANTEKQSHTLAQLPSSSDCVRSTNHADGASLTLQSQHNRL